MPLFGFLKRKEEEVPDLETHEITMEELPDWFRGVMREDIRQRLKESEQMYKDLVAGISDIRSRLDKLDSARMSGNERLHIAANMIKESFTKRKYMHLSEIARLYDGFRPDYAYFTEFQSKVMEALSSLKESTPKQTILLSRYFKKESNELVESIKRAEDISARLGGFLKDSSGPLSALQEIESVVNDCRDLLREASGFDSRSSEIRKQIVLAKERRQELEKRFLKLLKSREWKDINSLENEIKKAMEDMRQAEMRLNSELSSVKRPIKEMEHALGKKGSLTPIQKNILRDFIRDPLKAVLSEAGLRELKKCVSALARKHGNIELRGKESIDTGDVAERVEKDVSRFVSEYQELKEDIAGKEKRLEGLSRLSSSKEGLESDIKKATEQAGRLEEEFKDIASRKAATAEQVSEKLKGLESMILNRFQKRVKISPHGLN